MHIPNTAIVVMSCDAYRDVASIFFELKKKYMSWWDGPCYYIDEEGDFDFPCVQTIHAGKNMDWNGRLKYALNVIPEKYVLYFQEDYLIGNPVDAQNLLDAVNYMRMNDIWYYKIDNFPKIRRIIPGTHYLSSIPSNKRYGINLLTAIIEKTHFLKMLPQNDSSAWFVETSFLKNVTKKFEYDIPGCVLDTRQIIDVHYGVRQGKWWPDTVRFFAEHGYSIDYSKRGYLEQRAVLRTKVGHFINHNIPTPFFRICKKMLRSLGVKFVSPY